MNVVAGVAVEYVVGGVLPDGNVVAPRGVVYQRGGAGGSVAASAIVGEER